MKPRKRTRKVKEEAAKRGAKKKEDAQKRAQKRKRHAEDESGIESGGSKE